MYETVIAMMLARIAAHHQSRPTTSNRANTPANKPRRTRLYLIHGLTSAVYEGLLGARPERAAYTRYMTRFLIVLVVVAVAFTIYTLVDVVLTDRSRVRAFPKPLWAAVVTLLPVIGGALWLIVGKARRTRGSVSRPIAPDDDPTFLNTLNRDEIAKRAEQEERLRRLEQELADLDDDTPVDPDR